MRNFPKWFLHVMGLCSSCTIHTERNESKISKRYGRALDVKSILENTFSLSTSLYGAKFDRSVKSKKCFRHSHTKIIRVYNGYQRFLVIRAESKDHSTLEL